MVAKIKELRAVEAPTDQQKEELAGLEVAAKVMGVDLPPVEEPTASPVEAEEASEPVQEAADFVSEPATEEPTQEAVEVAEEETPAETPEEPKEQSHEDLIRTDRKILWTMMEQLDTLKTLHPEAGRELSMGYTKLQESRHWLGEVLGKLGIELPSEYADKA